MRLGALRTTTLFAGVLLVPMLASGNLIVPSSLAEQRGAAGTTTEMSGEEQRLLDLELQGLLDQIVFEPISPGGAQRPDEALRTAENLAEARRLWLNRVAGARSRTEFVPARRPSIVGQEALAPRRFSFGAKEEYAPRNVEQVYKPTSHVDAHTPLPEESADSFALPSGWGHAEARNACGLSARQEWLHRMVAVEPQGNRVSSPVQGASSVPGAGSPRVGGVSVLNAGIDASPELPDDFQRQLLVPIRFEFQEGSLRVVAPTQAQTPDFFSFAPATPHASAVSTLHIGPFHWLDPLIYFDLRVAYDWVINEGDWVIRGDQARVWVHAGIRQEGRLTVADGALLAKATGAIVNNGLLYVTNGATFVDASIINARSSDAWIYVDTASSITATRSFVTGQRSGVTGTVVVSNGSHLQAGTNQRVDLTVGSQGYGIVEATDSTIGITGALIVGERNGGGGEVHLLGNAQLWAEDVILAEHVNATAELTMENGSSMSGRNLVVGSKGSATLSAVDSALDFTGSVTISDHTLSTSAVVLDNSSFSVDGDVRMGTKNLSTASFAALNGSQVEIGGNLAVGGHASADTLFAIESGSSADMGGSVNVAANSTLRADHGALEIGGGLQVSGALEASAATLSMAADLTLGANSSISGLNGTEMIVGGNFISDITDPDRFDLTGTTVMFDSATATSHTLSVAGADYGPSMSGYVDNFSFYALRLGAGHSLTLQDVNGAGGALYVRILDLADGLGQLGDLVTNGLNIYYDPTAPENAYLMGETHDLDIAWLIPIPEPTSGFLLLFGLASLLVARCKTTASCIMESTDRETPRTSPHTREGVRV